MAEILYQSWSMGEIYPLLFSFCFLRLVCFAKYELFWVQGVFCLQIVEWPKNNYLLVICFSGYAGETYLGKNLVECIVLC